MDLHGIPDFEGALRRAAGFHLVITMKPSRKNLLAVLISPSTTWIRADEARSLALHGPTAEAVSIWTTSKAAAPFLKSRNDLPYYHQQIVAAVVELASERSTPAGEWVKLARTSGNHWREVERSVLRA
jgi:hypothetical protein